MTENSLLTMERKLVEGLSAMYMLDTDEPVLSRQRTVRALEGVSTLVQHVRDRLRELVVHDQAYQDFDAILDRGLAILEGTTARLAYPGEYRVDDAHLDWMDAKHGMDGAKGLFEHAEMGLRDLTLAEAEEDEESEEEPDEAPV